jgi:hypothetical protein
MNYVVGRGSRTSRRPFIRRGTSDACELEM